MKLPRLFITVILFAACTALLAQAQSQDANKCYTEWDFCNSGSEAENEYYWRLGWCASAIERGAVSASPSACMGQEEGTVTFPPSSKSSSSSVPSSPPSSSSLPSSASSLSSAPSSASGSSSSSSASASQPRSVDPPPEPQKSAAQAPRDPEPRKTPPHDNDPPYTQIPKRHEYVSTVKHRGVDGSVILGVDADGNLLWPPVSVLFPYGCIGMTPYPELRCDMWR